MAACQSCGMKRLGMPDYIEGRECRNQDWLGE